VEQQVKDLALQQLRRRGELPHAAGAAKKKKKKKKDSHFSTNFYLGLTISQDNSSSPLGA